MTSQNDAGLELETDGYMLRFPAVWLAAEVAEFEALPRAREAVAVRRWDDQAKDPAATSPRFAHFAPLLEALVRI